MTEPTPKPMTRYLVRFRDGTERMIEAQSLYYPQGRFEFRKGGPYGEYDLVGSYHQDLVLSVEPIGLAQPSWYSEVER